MQINRELCEFYGTDVSSAVGGAVNAGGLGETAAEQDADAAMEEMLEVEGAGKEIIEDREGVR